MSRLFVSQELLDQWSAEGKVELSGTSLQIAGEPRTFEIQSGARFLKLAAGQDRHKLLGKVKTEPQLASVGAELYMNSVLIGEDAYDVQPGFLCEVPPGATEVIGGAAEVSPPAAVPPGYAPAHPKTVDERTALAQFLLENLT